MREIERWGKIFHYSVKTTVRNRKSIILVYVLQYIIHHFCSSIATILRRGGKFVKHMLLENFI